MCKAHEFVALASNCACDYCYVELLQEQMCPHAQYTVLGKEGHAKTSCSCSLPMNRFPIHDKGTQHAKLRQTKKNLDTTP